MNIIKEISKKDPYIEVGIETVCFFCGELENTPHDKFCTWKKCEAQGAQYETLEAKIATLTAFNESMQTDARKNTETINKLKQALTDIRATTVMLGDSQGGWKAWRECCEIAGKALK